MLDLRFTNVENKNKNSKYEKEEKYVKFQRLYKRYEKEIEKKVKNHIIEYKKLKKQNDEYKLYKRNKSEGRFRLFSKENLSNKKREDFVVLKRMMYYLDLYFELKSDLAELFSEITHTLEGTNFKTNSSIDYSSKVDKFIKKINTFKTIKLKENSSTTGGKKKKVVRKRVKKNVKKSGKKSGKKVSKK